MSRTTNAAPKPEGHGTYDSMGITRQTGLEKLLFNRAGKMLVAHCFRNVDMQHQTRSLFYRPVNAHFYTPVAINDDFTSHEYPVSSSDAPLIIFLVHKWERCGVPQNPFWGGDWTSIQSVDLVTGAVEVELEAADLRSPPGVDAIWVSGLMEAWPNGRGVTCSSRLEFSRKKEAECPHWICDLAFDSGEVTPISQIEMCCLGRYRDLK